MLDTSIAMKMDVPVSAASLPIQMATGRLTLLMLAKIVTSAPVNGQSAFAGRLSGVEDERVLVTEGRRTHRIPLTAIKRARLEVEF